MDDEDFTREILHQVETLYCTEESKIEDYVPEGYEELEDIGIRDGDVRIHIPEDLSRELSIDCRLQKHLVQFIINIIDDNLS